MIKTLFKFTTLLVLTVFAVSFTLVACSNEDISADEGLPKGFTKVTETNVYGNTAFEIRHKETGCHYILVDGTQAVTITQMYTPQNGNAPYCD